MIHRLRVKNFYSFRDEVEIDLTASGPAPEWPGHVAKLYEQSNVWAPRVVGLFGPNAAGKSSLLRALSFVSWFVQHSFTLQPGNPIPVHRFRGAGTQSNPVEISLGFTGPVDLFEPFVISSPECRYEYCITLGDGASQPDRVLSECLFYWPPGSVRRVRVFERDGESIVRASRLFHLAGYTKPLVSVLRPNVSLISTLVQLGHPPSITLRDIARCLYYNILVEKYDYPDHYTAQQYLASNDMVEALNKEIQRLDLGIKEVAFAKPASPQHMASTTFTHLGLSDPIPAGLESHGTRQFVRIFPLISAALDAGGVAVIDEIDSSIHPFVLPEIIRWFYDEKRNKRNAQLWFTCQNPYLLSHLSKEEIFFCEKDGSGVTTAFGLGGIKSVRRADNYVKKYLGGTYGAVPHFG
jgi:hypothetical protein